LGVACLRAQTPNRVGITLYNELITKRKNTLTRVKSGVIVGTQQNREATGEDNKNGSPEAPNKSP
jgi:hypothetical protein